VRATHALAVDSNELAAQRGAEFAHPTDEARLEALRIEQREDATEGVVRSDAIGERQMPPEPVQSQLGPYDDHHPIVGTADDGAQGDEQKFIQRVGTSPGTRIFKIGERVHPTSTV